MVTIRWSPTNWLKDLGYADDICLLCHTYCSMKTKLGYHIKETDFLVSQLMFRKR